VIILRGNLLEIAFVILSRDEPYKDPKVDCEKLMVMRNAPTWMGKLRKYDYLPAYLQ
jgi:hypothetical protein